MKCFLHIGTEKTATTTIQEFFDINRSNILKHGFIYTKKAGKTNNRRLPVAAYNPHRRDDFTKSFGFDTNAKLASFQKQTVADLISEIRLIRKNFTKASTVIFSSEHIQSRLTNLEEIKSLKKILIDMGFIDISIIVYLRRPAEIANSLYSTAVKAGSCAATPPQPNNEYWNNVCNHKQTIENFASVFGRNAIIPRLFNKNDFVNGSVIYDILSVTGIPSDNYDIPNNANESLSLMGVNVLRRLNKTVPRFIDNKPNKMRENLVSYIVKHFSDSKYIMPHSLYEIYDSKFKESNEWVRRNYFPNKQILFSSEIPKEVCLNASDLELDRIADMISNIWKDKQTIITNLRKSST